MVKIYFVDILFLVDRFKVFGNFNVIFNFGFVVGLLIGGYFVMVFNGFFKVVMLIGFIFMVNFFFVWFCVKLVEDLKG